MVFVPEKKKTIHIPRAEKGVWPGLARYSSTVQDVGASILRDTHQGRIADGLAAGYSVDWDSTCNWICHGIFWRSMGILQKSAVWQYDKKGLAG